ncbi:MAG TPA: exosortase/archaeosortase family protein [Candidatus Dormibacteraeota bacterium]|jgi:exosortase/archaeosortase family protein|nr:exosortase/archaeosortase family protein [Candidatus Dormibacteraeota bacterium]
MSRRGRDPVNITLIAISCALLMLLPLVTTFDDFLTSWAMQLGVNNPLQAIVPVEARMVVSILGLAGIRSAAAGSNIAVWDGAGTMHSLFISWNCIGWQSLVLLGVSFFSGLRGQHPIEFRIQVIVIGVAGTVFVNLIRVAAVAALEVTWGHVPALLFHDYGGTVIIVVWLFGFWAFVHRWILVSPASDQLELMPS